MRPCLAWKTCNYKRTFCKHYKMAMKINRSGTYKVTAKNCPGGPSTASAMLALAIIAVTTVTVTVITPRRKARKARKARRVGRKTGQRATTMELP